MGKSVGSGGTVIIKKYANRRLYDTSTSAYVTLDHLSDLVRREVEFVVVDAKTGEDLTRQVLTQIIFERETKGEGALPVNFLRKLIGFYGAGPQALLPAWLEMSMNSFSDSQEKWTKSVGGVANPFTLFEKQARANMDMFEQAMRMFMPGIGSSRPRSSSRAMPESAPLSGRDAGGDKTQSADPMQLDEDAVNALRSQLQDMQAQLDALSVKR